MEKIYNGDNVRGGSIWGSSMKPDPSLAEEIKCSKKTMLDLVILKRPQGEKGSSKSHRFLTWATRWFASEISEGE